MRIFAFRAAVLAVVGGTAPAAVAWFSAADRTLALHAYLLFLGALGLLVAARSAVPPSVRRRRFPRRRRRRKLPEDLARLEAQVSLASASAFDLHFHLRPLLRDLAADRLRRRGVDLDADPDDARALLGADAWELVRPDRAEPADGLARGLPLAQLGAVVTAIEAI